MLVVSDMWGATREWSRKERMGKSGREGRPAVMAEAKGPGSGKVIE